LQPVRPKAWSRNDEAHPDHIWKGGGDFTDHFLHDLLLQDKKVFQRFFQSSSSNSPVLELEETFGNACISIEPTKVGNEISFLIRSFDLLLIQQKSNPCVATDSA
jgi:hypothetical protein